MNHFSIIRSSLDAQSVLTVYNDHVSSVHTAHRKLAETENRIRAVPPFSGYYFSQETSCKLVLRPQKLTIHGNSNTQTKTLRAQAKLTLHCI